MTHLVIAILVVACWWLWVDRGTYIRILKMEKDFSEEDVKRHARAYDELWKRTVKAEDLVASLEDRILEATQVLRGPKDTD